MSQIQKKIKSMKPAFIDDFKECCKMKLKIKLLNTSNRYETVTSINSCDSLAFSLAIPKDELYSPELLQNQKILGTIFHPDKIIGVTFRIVHIDNNQIFCDLPLEIFEIDSRENERLVIDAMNIASLKASFTIDDENNMHPVSCQIYDISLHGFSILVPSEIANTFKPTNQFKIVNLKILGTQITFSAESMNMYFLPDRKSVLKVGFRITKIQTSHSNILAKYLEKKKEQAIKHSS